jgi:PadR family transcriptional regulator, regulatory protein PadR
LAKPNSAQTALDLLVLSLLERRGPLHGYDIAKAIEEWLDERLRVEVGSLYPALHRMEGLGWILRNGPCAGLQGALQDIRYV